MTTTLTPESPKPEFTLTHVIENVSQLTSTRQYGPTVLQYNVPWRLKYFKNDTYFGLHLYCEKDRNVGDWSVDTTFSLKIISPNGKSETKPASNNVFGSGREFIGWGFPQAKLWDTFMDEFVVHNRVIIEVHVVINSMRGIEKPEKFRKFNDEKKGDVVLVAGEEKFHVSKLYLTSVSSYFNTLLLGPFEDSQKSEIHLQGIDPDIFQIYLELIHMEPTLTDSNVEAVMTLVDMYDTKNGTRICEEFLMYQSKNSMKNRLQMAQKFKMEKLKNYCIDSMKTAADVRAAIMGSDLDPEILGELFEKTLSF